MKPTNDLSDLVRMAHQCAIDSRREKLGQRIRPEVVQGAPLFDMLIALRSPQNTAIMFAVMAVLENSRMRRESTVMDLIPKELLQRFGIKHTQQLRTYFNSMWFELGLEDSGKHYKTAIIWRKVRHIEFGDMVAKFAAYKKSTEATDYYTSRVKVRETVDHDL